MAHHHLAVAVLPSLAAVLLLLLSSSSAPGAHAARILVVMPIYATSHHISLGGVTRALERAGHHVTYVTGLAEGNAANPTSHTLVHVGNPLHDDIRKLVKHTLQDKVSYLERLAIVMGAGSRTVNHTLTHPAFIAEVNRPGQHYDLILTEAFVFQEAFLGLAHQFQAPVVAFNPTGAFGPIDDAMGNPTNPAWVPMLLLGYTNRMTLFERTFNTLGLLFSTLYQHLYNLPTQQRLLSAFWPDAPPLAELMRSRLALTLVNSHHALAWPVPLSPAVVEIGGIHIADEPPPLPEDLQAFLDSAGERGVVYFSMGSIVRIADLPRHKADAIVRALGSLEERVVLKWDGPVPDNMSANVRLVTWAPQAALLAHPNVRAFVTHGGLLSTQEAVYHGVPVVSVPVFGDQEANVRLAVHKGFCVRVDLKTLSEQTLRDALHEVLRNPRYKEAATRLSRLFRSKAIHPARLAVWAVEHVLQHGGGDHLRPSSVDLPLHQLLLLDVLLVAVLTVAVLALGCRFCCGSALRLLCKPKERLQQQQQRKNDRAAVKPKGE